MVPVPEPVAHSRPALTRYVLSGLMGISRGSFSDSRGVKFFNELDLPVRLLSTIKMVLGSGPP
jgi:hypothetical protein